MKFSTRSHDTFSLTDKVMAYKATGEGWETIREAICLFVYEYNPRWISWNEDTRSDFLLFFYPRIKSMVEKYVPNFRFETYLISAIRWGIVRFREKEQYRQHEVSWIVREMKKQSSQTEDENFFNQDSPELNLPFQIDTEGRIADLTTRRRLICAIMLTAADLQTEVVPEIAHLIGVKSDWLHGKLGQVKRMIEERYQKRRRLEERINECWFKMDSARSMSSTANTENRRNMWDKRLKTWSKRYLVASDTIKGLKVKPSHSEIGEILNIPTGTVSSSLHHLRKILERPQQNIDEHHKRLSQRGDLNP